MAVTQLISGVANAKSNAPGNAGSTTPSRCGGDRFIPNRSSMDLDLAHHALVNNENESANVPADGADALADQLRRQKLGEALHGGAKKERILAFRSKPPEADESHANTLKVSLISFVRLPR